MKHLHRYLSFGMLGSLFVLVGCSGDGHEHGADDDPWSHGWPATGTSAGAPSTAGSSGSTDPDPYCVGLSCGEVCGTYSNFPGGALLPMYCDLDSRCEPAAPYCGPPLGGSAGAATATGGAPAGGAYSWGGGPGGGPSSPGGGPAGGAYAQGGSPAGGAEVGGSAGACAGSASGSVVGGGVCAGMVCGAVCGYFSQYPGGPTEPMMCDPNQRCSPVVPYCGY